MNFLQNTIGINMSKELLDPEVETETTTTEKTVDNPYKLNKPLIQPAPKA